VDDTEIAALLGIASGVPVPEAFQHSLFRSAEFAGTLDDRGDLALFGQQESLKLAGAHGRIDREVRLVHGGMVDLLGDGIQTPGALSHRGMRAGEHLCQHAVGVGRRAVLAGQSRLPRLDGGYRRSCLFRHRLTLFVIAVGESQRWGLVG